MARFEHTVEIARAPEEVFAYLTDLRNLPEWQASLVEVRPEREGAVEVGTRFREVRSAMGRRVESAVEVTELEPPRVFTVRATSGPLPFTVRHTLDGTDGATRLRVEAEGEPRGALRFAGPMVMRAAERQFRSDFERLKTVLETRASS